MYNNISEPVYAIANSMKIAAKNQDLIKLIKQLTPQQLKEVIQVGKAKRPGRASSEIVTAKLNGIQQAALGVLMGLGLNFGALAQESSPTDSILNAINHADTTTLTRLPSVDIEFQQKRDIEDPASKMEDRTGPTMTKAPVKAPTKLSPRAPGYSA